MKKLLIIFSNSSMLSTILVNTQNYINSNDNTNLSFKSKANNVNLLNGTYHTVTDEVKDNNYIYDLDKVNIWHLHSQTDNVHTFKHNLYLINYGSMGYDSLKTYFHNKGNFYDPNFKITSSIGTKKWTEKNVNFSSPISSAEFIDDLNKNMTMTNEVWEDGGDYNLRSMAQVQMKLVDDSNARIVYAEITSIVENNNAWYNVYNEIKI